MVSLAACEDGGGGGAGGAGGGQADAGRPGDDLGPPGDDAGTPEDDAGAADSGLPDDLVARGEALFTQYCAVCHGPDAAGGAVYPGSIQGRTAIYPIIHQGRGAMPPVAALDEDDALAIEAWLATFVEVPPETPAELFALTCAGCHGAAGEGSARGPQIQRPVVPYATWVVRHGRQRPDFADPMAPYSEAELTPDELAGILGWLGEAPKPADGAGLYTMFCGNCHGADAGGGVVEVRLVGRPAGDFQEKAREGEGGSAYGARRQYMPRWTRAELSDAEVLRIWGAVNGQ